MPSQLTLTLKDGKDKLGRAYNASVTQPQIAKLQPVLIGLHVEKRSREFHWPPEKKS